MKRIILCAFICVQVGWLTECSASSERGWCMSNVRWIDAAKERCSYEKNLKDGDDLKEEWLLPYLREETMVVCPGGGMYTINKVGRDPKCSIEAHSFAAYLQSYRDRDRKKMLIKVCCLMIPLVVFGGIFVGARAYKKWPVVVICVYVVGVVLVPFVLQLVAYWIWPDLYSRND